MTPGLWLKTQFSSRVKSALSALADVPSVAVSSKCDLATVMCTLITSRFDCVMHSARGCF